MSIPGTLGEIAGAAAAVEALEKADPNASLLTKGMAAVAGFKGAGALEALIERRTQDGAGDSEQAEQAYGQMVEAYPSNGMVADDVIEKDLEIARQTGAIKNRVPLSRVIDFQFVKAAREELSGKK